MHQTPRLLLIIDKNELFTNKKGKELITLRGHTSTVKSLVYHESGILVSGSDDMTIKLWNTTSGEVLRTLTGHTSSVYSVALDKNGVLASASYDKTVKLWDMAGGQVMKTLVGHNNGVTCVSFDKLSGVLASGDFNNMIRVWN